MKTLTIENDGGKIVATNYWQTEAARAGKFYLSINSATVRLLCPVVAPMEELATGKEIVATFRSRGGQPSSVFLMFDDGTETPFCLELSTHAVDRWPPREDAGRILDFVAYTEGPTPYLTRKATLAFQP